MWPKIYREIFRFNKTKFWLLLILVLAALLRIFRLNCVPIELFGDELDVGYHALSLWQTGQDYFGQMLPIYIHSLNEWRAPLLMYVTAPFVGLWGLNEWGVRLPSAVFGLLSIFLIYLLVQKLTKNERLSLLAAFVCAIIPWHIHYSRAAFEVTLLLCLVLGGTISFLSQRWWLSAVCFGLSLYTYNTANIFGPLLLLGLILIRHPSGLLKKKGMAGIVIFGILCLPILATVLRGQGATRFKSINIFNNPQAIDTIVFKRTTGLSPTLERVFHNKIESWGRELLDNYLISLSPQFLFLTGDPNPRHNLPNFGELYLGMLPFLVIGAINLFKSQDEELKKITFLWLLAAPIPSALTLDGGNHATRLFLMVPALAILIAYGLNSLLRSWKLLTVAVGVFLVLTLFWLHEYFVHYPKEQSHYWHSGYKEALLWLKNNQAAYPKIILNNEHDPILMGYLFWTGKDPEWLRKNYTGDLVKKEIIPGFNGFRVGNLLLGGIAGQNKGAWLQENLDEQTVYLAFQKDEVPGDWNWEKSPPPGIKVLKVVKETFSGEPYIYLLTKDTR